MENMIERILTSRTGSFVSKIREKLSFSLSKFALICTHPFQRFSEVLTHFKQDKNSLKVSLHLIFCLLLAPAAIFLWMVGGFLDLFSKTFQPKPYIYLSGKKKGDKKGEDNFSCLIFNTCMLWGGLPFWFGGVVPARQRIDKLSELILSRPFDFIFLQELSERFAFKLWDKIKQNYQFGLTGIGRQAFTSMGSLLFIASKHPVSEVKVFKLPTHKWVKRNVVCLEIPSCWLITTHLESGSKPEDAKMRGLQLQHIHSILMHLEAQSNKPCFLFGDLNVERTEESNDEYSYSLIPPYFKDYYQKKYPIVSPETATHSKLLNSRSKRSREDRAYAVLDYALEHRNPLLPSKERVTHLEVVETYIEKDRNLLSLSDHKALLVCISP